MRRPRLLFTDDPYPPVEPIDPFAYYGMWVLIGVVAATFAFLMLLAPF